MKTDNYFVITGYMCNDLRLSGNDLLVYAAIHSFSQDGVSSFTGSRKWLAETFNVSLPTIDKALRSLLEKGLIEKDEKELNGVKFCSYKTLQGVKNLYGGSKESLQGGSKESLHNITNINNTSNSNSKEKEILKKDALETVLLSRDLIKNNPDLLQAFKDFIEMRKTLKKPLTVKALQLSVNKAYELAHGDTDKMRAIVEQSVQRSWQGLFPIKEEQQQAKIPKTSNGDFWDKMLKEADYADENSSAGNENPCYQLPDEIL